MVTATLPGREAGGHKGKTMHKAYFDFVGILGLVVAAIMMAVGVDAAEPAFVVVGGMVLVMVVLVAFIKSRLPQ